jgi:hypothetical protein
MHKLGWNLTLGHTKEFAHAYEALVTFCPNFGILKNNQHDVNFAPLGHRLLRETPWINHLHCNLSKVIKKMFNVTRLQLFYIASNIFFVTLDKCNGHDFLKVKFVVRLLIKFRSLSFLWTLLGRHF